MSPCFRAVIETDTEDCEMRTSRVIQVVSCHAEGEVGDVIVGGVAPPPGATLWEQRAHHVADGIPAITDYMLNQNNWASQIRTPELLKILVSYGAHAKSAIP
jgi:Proline racemase